MNWSRILECFREELCCVPISGGAITGDMIAMPNCSFDCTGRKIWFELSVNPGEQYWLTENDRRALAVVNLTVCVPQDSDYVRSNNIAARILNHFIGENVFHRVIRITEGMIYIDEVTQLPSSVINEIYKTGIRLDLTIVGRTA